LGSIILPQEIKRRSRGRVYDFSIRNGSDFRDPAMNGSAKILI
jgi:hypothetical protein